MITGYIAPSLTGSHGPQGVQDLLRMLDTHTLSPAFPRFYGKRGDRLYFFGNFTDCAYVFRFSLPAAHPDAAALTAAIDANRRSPGYARAKAAQEVRHELVRANAREQRRLYN